MYNWIVHKYEGSQCTAHSRAQAVLARAAYCEQWLSAKAPEERVFEERLRASGFSRVRVAWLAMSGKASVIGAAYLRLPEGSRGIARVDVYVDPSFRGHGVGRSLLRAVAAEARQRKALLLAVSSREQTRPSDHLAVECDAHLSRTDRVVQVELGERINAAETRVEELSPTRTTEVFSGACPSVSLLLQTYRLRRAVAAAYGPKPLDMTAAATIESARRSDLAIAAQRLERWTICVIENQRVCVGFSEYIWDPYEPEILAHKHLAVVSGSKEYGVVRALVAARERIVARRPSIKRVRYMRSLRVSPHRYVNDNSIVSESFLLYRWLVPLSGLERYVNSRLCREHIVQPALEHCRDA